jgi:multidrug efflux pump subunit AcrB
MEYPGVNFEVSDTQRETIEQSTKNIFDSLRDAIIMSTIVVFLFLASFRQILVVLVILKIGIGEVNKINFILFQNNLRLCL